jgi:Outer membrane protein beta-barrel domain
MKHLLRMAGILALCTIGPAIVHAQLSIGAKGGLNVSNLSNLTVDNATSQALVGFHVGGYLALNLGRNFALQPELMYSTQGAKLENATDNLNLNYINVPVMLRFYTNGGFFLEGGPQLGFQVGQVTVDNVEEEINNTDLSVCGGLGYMGKSQGFGIGARYNAGISKLGDANSSNIQNPDFRNGVFQLSLYFRILGGGKLKNKK